MKIYYFYITKSLGMNILKLSTMVIGGMLLGASQSLYSISSVTIDNQTDTTKYVTVVYTSDACKPDRIVVGPRQKAVLDRSYTSLNKGWVCSIRKFFLDDVDRPLTYAEKWLGGHTPEDLGLSSTGEGVIRFSSRK